ADGGTARRIEAADRLAVLPYDLAGRFVDDQAAEGDELERVGDRNAGGQVDGVERAFREPVADLVLFPESIGTVFVDIRIVLRDGGGQAIRRDADLGGQLGERAGPRMPGRAEDIGQLGYVEKSGLSA